MNNNIVDRENRKEFLQVIFFIKSNYLICIFASNPTNFNITFALLATAEYCLIFEYWIKMTLDLKILAKSLN